MSRPKRPTRRQRPPADLKIIRKIGERPVPIVRKTRDEAPKSDRFQQLDAHMRSTRNRARRLFLKVARQRKGEPIGHTTGFHRVKAAAFRPRHH